MKVRYLSDLHVENTPYELKYDDEDVLILAGDISSSKEDTLELITDYMDKNLKPHVIFVLGNHDYYGSSFSKIENFWSKIESEFDNNRFHHLQDQSIVINGVRFHGCTLWTDLVGADRQIIENGVNDYRYIDYFSVPMCKVMHDRSRKIVDETLKNSREPVVVISHHLPSFQSVRAKYRGLPYNSAFASNMDYIVRNSRYWIHGHTHSTIKYKIGDAQVLCNPRGRVIGDWRENMEFVDYAHFTIESK